MIAFRMFVPRSALLLATAAVALTGCAGSMAPRSASAQGGKTAAVKDRAVAQAEQAVQRAPQDAAARAALGQAYLSAGRFASAATTLDDAMVLGDNSGRTALALALAKIGAGRQREALALLDDWRAEIPASDFGLALALAGDPSRGVAVLSDAVRSGESTPKLRQNLAYAYALDGRWAEARLMAAQDVPAAELDQRIASWALSALPDQNQTRVAALIGAPLRSDPGQPAALALNTSPVSEQRAVEMAAIEPEPAARSVAQPAAELPALAAAEPAPAAAPAASVIEQNLSTQRQVAVAPAPAHRVVARPESPRPSVAVAFAPLAAAAAAKPVRARAAAPLAGPRVATGGTHLVQLGAFSSQQGARRAWGIFAQRTPGLSGYRMVITAANVRGKAVWRVAAAGLNGAGAASGLCSQVKAGGGACFAYAVPVRTPIGPAQLRSAAGPQRARR